MRRSLLPLVALVASLSSCSSTPPDTSLPTRWTVLVAADAPRAVRIAADDVVTYLGRMGQTASLGTTSNQAPSCAPGEGRVVFTGDAIPAAPDAPALASAQSFAIVESRCSGGALVVLSGGGLLGRQYAAYEWLHALGVRFFHPEDEFVPESPTFGTAPLRRVHTPSFTWRSVSLHLTHPLELGDAFNRAVPELEPEGTRYIDWSIKNGASRGLRGVGVGANAEYGLMRGLPREAGFSLHNQQQGGRPIVNPDDPRTEEQQIAAAIDERMGTDPARTPQFFSFTFNPSEFTEIPDTDAVRQISFITRYITENYPGTEVETINHGTAARPTANYGVRFYDLSQFAPPELGVKVHTLMFYDVFRRAPVYGNDDFTHLYRFMEREHTRRRIVYFPEAAWWLTFDIAVPLYLPITLDARDRDIQGIKWMLAGGLDGHHTFGSGHEWGYWQNEYCSLRMAMDVDYRLDHCLSDVTSPTGPAAGEVKSVLQEVIRLQERDFITHWEDTLAYLVGTDPETEVAASVGVVFHPLPPTPAAMMRWTQAEVDAWLAKHPPALRRMDDEYAALAARLRAVAPQVPMRGKRFFEEVLDGVEVTGLRARHGWQVYGAVAEFRAGQLANDDARQRRAKDQLERAVATTTAASAVITRREAQYRYLPISRSIAGGPDFTEDSNWTVYRYRYLARTHHAYYWSRIDRLATEAIEGGGSAVEVPDTLLSPGESLSVAVRDAELTMPSVDWGDGTPAESGATSYSHVYATEGGYTLRIQARRGVDPFTLEGTVARVTSEAHTGFSGTIVQPEGASLIAGVMPSVTFGRIDAARIALGFGTTRSGEIGLGWTRVLPSRAGSTKLFETEPTEVLVPVVNRGTGTISATMRVRGAVLEVENETSPVVLRGDLDTSAVIDAVVAVGGFDPPGARRIVASTLGYTPDTLPASVAFEVRFMRAN